MVSCNHESCGKENRVWLPSDAYLKSEAVLHPWCKHCGLIKNISDDHPHDAGYWMNILSRIAHHFSLKQVQRRLIAQDLNSHDCFGDLYGITGSAKKELFIRIIKKYCNIDMHSIDSFDY